MAIKPCTCGSGKLRYEQYDARGIFLYFFCDKCEAEKQKKFRPEVFTNPSYDTTEDVEPDGPSDLADHGSPDRRSDRFGYDDPDEIELLPADHDKE